MLIILLFDVTKTSPAEHSPPVVVWKDGIPSNFTQSVKAKAFAFVVNEDVLVVTQQLLDNRGFFFVD